jgi:hypothetical protein
MTVADIDYEKVADEIRQIFARLPVSNINIVVAHNEHGNGEIWATAKAPHESQWNIAGWRLNLHLEAG